MFNTSFIKGTSLALIFFEFFSANLPIDGFNSFVSQYPNGVYYGFASVEGGPVYKMAMNIGWSPYYGNKEKTLVS